MSVAWGFVGAGNIASRALAPAVHAARGARLYAVASRDPARSAALRPETVYHDYAALLEDPNVDAVYVSLANSQHAEWVIAALEAGKHVLCEKPLGMNAEEAEAMFAAASRADRLLVEAVWTRWHPRFVRMVELARGGEIGEVARIDAEFTFAGVRPGNYRLDRSMGGGALLDVGCYQVHAWLAFLGVDAELESVLTRVALGSSGVDLTTEVEARMKGVTCRAIASFERAPRQQLVVEASRATMRTLDGESFSAWGVPTSLRIGSRTERFDAVDAFQSMVEAVSDRVTGGDSWVLPSADSIRVARILDEVARVARLR